MTRSGLFEAGGILLLVGAILSTFGGAMMVLVVASISFATGEWLGLLVVLYGVLGMVMLAGAVCGYVAYGKARAGDVHGAWILGLVASLLPPAQPVLLVGAILCKVSPECKTQQGHAPPQPWA